MHIDNFLYSRFHVGCSQNIRLLCPVCGLLLGKCGIFARFDQRKKPEKAISSYLCIAFPPFEFGARDENLPMECFYQNHCDVVFFETG